jgi:hypothetical protein
VTPLTTASASTQPARNIGAFTFARCENSIKITAMIGTGLIAAPTAKVRTWLIPCPKPSPSGRPVGSRAAQAYGPRYPFTVLPN